MIAGAGNETTARLIGFMGNCSANIPTNAASSSRTRR